MKISDKSVTRKTQDKSEISGEIGDICNTDTRYTSHGKIGIVLIDFIKFYELKSLLQSYNSSSY